MKRVVFRLHPQLKSALIIFAAEKRESLTSLISKSLIHWRPSNLVDNIHNSSSIKETTLNISLDDEIYMILLDIAYCYNTNISNILRHTISQLLHSISSQVQENIQYLWHQGDLEQIVSSMLKQGDKYGFSSIVLGIYALAEFGYIDKARELTDYIYKVMPAETEANHYQLQIGRMYAASAQRDPQTILDLSKEVIPTAINAHDRASVGRTYIHRAAARIMQDNPDAAQAEFDIAREYLDYYTYPAEYSMMYSKMANLYCLKGDYDSAQKKLERINIISSDFPQLYSRTSLASENGLIQFLKGNYQQGIDTVQAGYPEVRDSLSYKIKADYADVMGIQYTISGKYQLATTILQTGLKLERKFFPRKFSHAKHLYMLNQGILGMKVPDFNTNIKAGLYNYLKNSTKLLLSKETNMRHNAINQLKYLQDKAAYPLVSLAAGSTLRSNALAPIR